MSWRLCDLRRAKASRAKAAQGEEPWINALLENTRFYTERTAFLEALEQARLIFRASLARTPRRKHKKPRAAPKAAPLASWQGSREILSQILKQHASLDLIPVCDKPECVSSACTAPSRHRTSRKLAIPGLKKKKLEHIMYYRTIPLALTGELEGVQAKQHEHDVILAGNRRVRR